jgi:hypothetical protein
MNAQCARCGLMAVVIQTGRSGFSLRPPPRMLSNCPVLIHRLEKKTPLLGEDLECEYLSQAAAAVFQEWRREANPMKLTAEDFRRNAEEAEEMAGRWPDPELQKAYRDIAKQWRNLADQAERVQEK